MEYSEDSQIPLGSIDVRLPILQCSDCDRVWRAEQPERCVYCAREYGALSQVVDAPRRRALFEAIQALPLEAIVVGVANMAEFYENARTTLTAALLKHCPWYDATDPFCTQACWFALQERCPWTHLNPHAQAKWDEFIGAKPDVTVTQHQLRDAALFFELHFEDCAHLAEQLDEDPQEKWAAYLEDQVELHGM
jgi:hypothetical protein